MTATQGRKVPHVRADIVWWYWCPWGEAEERAHGQRGDGWEVSVECCVIEEVDGFVGVVFVPHEPGRPLRVSPGFQQACPLVGRIALEPVVGERGGGEVIAEVVVLRRRIGFASADEICAVS